MLGNFHLRELTAALQVCQQHNFALSVQLFPRGEIDGVWWKQDSPLRRLSLRMAARNHTLRDVWPDAFSRVAEKTTSARDSALSGDCGMLVAQCRRFAPRTMNRAQRCQTQLERAYSRGRTMNPLGSGASARVRLTHPTDD